MRSPPGAESAAVWTEAGSTAAAVARGYHAVAVLAADGDAAAAAARAIAAALVPGRRVILADLVGDVPLLRDLSTEPDPEGVQDSFDFGISLVRIARPTPVENFLLIPSADDSVAREEVFSSGRWTRLARQCRASGWLLLVAARTTAPGVAGLVEQLDGAILLGKDQPAEPVRVLHRLESTPGGRRLRIGRAPLIVGGAAAALILIAAFALWRTYGEPDGRLPPAAPAAVEPLEASRAAASIRPANPADSAAAVAYAVELMSANTRAGANLELQRNRATYPAVTLTAVPVGEAQAIWFRMIAGAYDDPRQADSLLRVARQSQAIGETGGAVVRTPFALLVDSVASPADLERVLARYIDRGAPAYALLQEDGRVFVYVGAFTSPEQSAIFSDELIDGGAAKPLLVYRTGRPF